MARWMRPIRFATIGVIVALTYMGLYLALLSLGMGAFVANGIAFLLAVVLQYVAQAAFTFERPLADAAQIIRFAVMIGAGFGTSILITGPLATALSLPAWQAALAVTVLLPIQNYILLSIWVFATPASSSVETS